MGVGGGKKDKTFVQNHQSMERVKHLSLPFLPEHKRSGGHIDSTAKQKWRFWNLNGNQYID